LLDIETTGEAPTAFLALFLRELKPFEAVRTPLFVRPHHFGCDMFAPARQTTSARYSARHDDEFAAIDFARLQKGLAAGNGDSRAGYVAR
jgi:hypothetical protein